MTRATKPIVEDDYNAAADATGSYYAAIEAKRKRGDASKPATAKPATKRRRKRDDDKPVVVAADVQAAGIVVSPANDNPAAPTPPLDYPQWDNQVPAEHEHDDPYKPQIWTAVKVAAIVVLVIGAVAWVL